MPVYKPSELKAFLESIGAKARRQLSQNFLIDGNIIRKTVSLAEIQPHDTVLEIGPGPGALTEALLEAGARVVAVEKDRRFADHLERLQTADNRLTVVCDDILAVNFEPMLPQRSKVVANLPYNLTSPILDRLLKAHNRFQSVTVMVQKEVAERLTAKSGGRDFSLLTLFINYHTHFKGTFDVGRRCFYPAPKVDSAVVRMDLRTPPQLSDEKAFWSLLKTAFGQRRKMLRSSLKKLYSPQDIENTLKEIKTAPTSRPEQLSLDQFIALFEKLKTIPQSN